MPKDKDYRNTQCCKELIDVSNKKERLEAQIQEDFPRTRIIYNKVKKRGGIYNRKFAEIYNEKCAYCGILLGLIPLESFEVDHFINEASFSDTEEDRIKAGRMENLIWSCIDFNRGKSGLTITPPYDHILNVDQGNICQVFERDKDFYIRINAQYKNDEFVKMFYDSLHLGYQRRRMDYLLLQMYGRMKAERNEMKKNKLGAAFLELLEARNRMHITDGKRI